MSTAAGGVTAGLSAVERRPDDRLLTVSSVSPPVNRPDADRSALLLLRVSLFVLLLPLLLLPAQFLPAIHHHLSYSLTIPLLLPPPGVIAIRRVCWLVRSFVR